MKNKILNTLSALLLLLIFLATGKIVTAQQNNLFAKKNVNAVMLKAFTWQVQNPVQINLKEDWARAVLYCGAMRAYGTTKKKIYINESMKYADSIDYLAGKRYRHADDMTRGQIFLKIYENKKKDFMLDGIKSRIDSLMNDPKPGREDWWWCDALFMEPPVLAMLSKQTNDEKYNDYLNKMWWDATDFLFDKEENLYYRDKSFFDKKAGNGKKLFWSRGNGWVMGGLVQVLETMPKSNAYYKKYEELYLKMATKIVSLQQPDGLWRASLLDPNEVAVKETSGSGFYTFALAWGINNGYLEREIYLPAVKKGWEALTDAVEKTGKLTWVQQIGGKPENVQQSDNQEYGTGAFLMAGTEILKLGIVD
jgi:unsaturated rhamnogalacturonyl hydrolase